MELEIHQAFVIVDVETLDHPDVLSARYKRTVAFSPEVLL
jgi:hypothetical protein